MRQKRVTQKDILFISISMFVIVALWIGFNIYHAWATSTISEDLQMQIVPIEAKFDIQTLNKLKTREKIKPIFELSNQVAENPATESAQPTPTIETPSPQPEADQPLAETEEPTPTP